MEMFPNLTWDAVEFCESGLASPSPSESVYCAVKLANAEWLIVNVSSTKF